MDRRVILVALCLLSVPVWAADNNEDCQNYVEPTHALDDGHEHWHHLAPANAHYHGGQLYPDGHTHEDHAYCNQVGMVRVPFEDAEPLRLLTAEEAVFHEPSVTIRGESYAFNTTTVQNALTITSDAVAAAMGLPGSGTQSDPYVIEGYFILKQLTIKDTDACFVVRNNVIDGSFIVGPMADLDDVLDLQEELALATSLLAQLEGQYDNASSALQDARDQFNLAKEEWNQFLALRDPIRVDVIAANAVVVDARNMVTYWAEKRNEARSDYQIQKETLDDLANQVLPSGPSLFAAVVELEKPDLEPLAQATSESYQEWQEADAQLRLAKASLAAAKLERSVARDQLLAYDVAKEQFLNPVQDARAIVQEASEENKVLREALKAARGDRNAYQSLLKQGQFLYDGTVFDSLEELAKSILEEQAVPAVKDAQLVLDWNGQCVHAYNNVVDDLRVNQNNARTGYATGGVIEDNRIFDVGQLRHYDGVFRENIVGNLDQLEAYEAGSDIEADRAANIDGFNQGLIDGNTFYGFVDLDFHGHHHGAGFFAPESHYHGDGEPKHRHDHTQRWTSVYFSNNLVIDPANYGLRYEDRNHEGDDRTANSETVATLAFPHVHRSQINIIDNTVVGSIFVDEFNADGVMVWSDTFEDILVDELGRVKDAVLHLGATILNTHPERNTGWLTIEGNTIYHTNNGRAALDILDLKEANVTVLGNTAFGSSEPGTGFELRRVKDAAFEICENQFLGFGRGFIATNQIMEDVTINTCSDNVWSGDPLVDIRFTEYEEEELTVTTIPRGITQGTAADPTASILYDQIDLRSAPVDELLGEVADALVLPIGGLL